MNINIKSTGMELTESIAAYAEKRLGSLDKYLNNKSAHMQIEVGRVTGHHKQGDVYKAEAHITGDGADYYGVCEAEDLYAAIDMLKDEIVSEIRKTRGKKRELLRRGQRRFKEIIRGFPWFGRGEE